MTYKSKKQRARRIEAEKAESIARYKEQQTASECSMKASIIVKALSRMTATKLTTADIVAKVQSEKELDYYYKGCCYE
jgi:hypothetical protein